MHCAKIAGGSFSALEEGGQKISSLRFKFFQKYPKKPSKIRKIPQKIPKITGGGGGSKIFIVFLNTLKIGQKSEKNRRLSPFLPLNPKFFAPQAYYRASI